MDLLIQGLLISEAVLLVFFAFIVILRSPKNLTHIFFSGFLICLSLWAIDTSIGFYSRSLSLIELSGDYIYPFAAFMVLFFVLFNLEFSDLRFRKILLYPLLTVCSSIMFFVLAIDDDFEVQSAIIINEKGANIYAVDGHGAVIGTTYYLAYAFLGILISFIAFANAKNKGHKKEKMFRNILIGQFATVMLAIMASIILFRNSGFSETYVFGPFAAIILSLFYIHAVLNYSLFQLKFAVGKAALYLTTILVLTVLYIFVGIVIFGQFFEIIREPADLIFFLGWSLVLSLTVPIMTRLITKLTNRIFLRHTYNAEKFFIELNSKLSGKHSYDEIEKSIISLISDSFGSSFVSLVPVDFAFELANVGTRIITMTDTTIANPTTEQYMLEHNVELIAPVIANQKTNYFLLLGHKANGHHYSSKEMKMIRGIAAEIARALENAEQYEQILNFNKTLKQEVKTATKDLQKANAKLDKLNQAKDDFIAIASHQLKSPVSAVKNSISLLKQTDSTDTNSSAELLRLMEESNNRTTQLIEELLDVTKATAGTLVGERKTSKLLPIVDQRVDIARQQAKQKRIQIIFKVSDDLKPVQIDPKTIRESIANLLDNAIKYSSPDTQIAVELKQTKANISLTVTDQGPGIPKQEQLMIFDKFYRSKKVSRQSDGLGLGLFLFKKIIEAHDGSVIFKSNTKGSTFGFKLPYTAQGF